MVLTYVRMEDMSGDLMLKEYALDNLIKQALKKYSRMFAMQKLALHYEALRVTVTTEKNGSFLYWSRFCPSIEIHSRRKHFYLYGR